MFDALGLDLSLTTYAIALASVACLGFAKAGFPGMALVNVVLLAELFGARESVGIILPLLIVCDLIVYPLFRKYASWREAASITAITAVGVVIGWLIMDRIDEANTKRALGIIILLMTGLQLLRERKTSLLKNLSSAKSLPIISGLGMGVSTMLANAAGPVYSIYALVKGMSKEEFIGICARCFLFINLFKLPFMANLDLLNEQSLKIDLVLLPGLVAGILLGKLCIEKIPQRAFEFLLYAFCIIAGLRMAIPELFRFLN